MAARNYTNTSSQATTSTFIDASATVVTLANFAGFPAPPFAAALDRGTTDEEVVLVTAVAGASVTMTRGYNGTTAKSHSASAAFQHVAIAADFAEANAHVNATTGVHGAAGALVDSSSAQSLSNKTLIAPAVTSPTITGATTAEAVNATDLTATGTLSVTGASTLAGGLAVSGALVASGGITVPTTKRVTLTDAPTAATDAVNKAYADALGSTAIVADTIVRRTPTDAAIGARVVFGLIDPVGNDHATNKLYLDTRLSTGAKWERAYTNNNYIYGIPANAGNVILPGMDFYVTIPAGKTLEVEVKVGIMHQGANGLHHLGLYFTVPGQVEVCEHRITCGGAEVWVPGYLHGSVPVPAGGLVNFKVMANLQSGSADIRSSPESALMVNYRIW